MKILYAEFELEKLDRKKMQKTRRDKSQMHQTPQSFKQQTDAGEGAADDPADDLGQMEGQTQKRGSDPAGEKCRITFEARQAVVGYFNGDARE